MHRSTRSPGAQKRQDNCACNCAYKGQSRIRSPGGSCVNYEVQPEPRQKTALQADQRNRTPGENNATHTCDTTTTRAPGVQQANTRNYARSKVGLVKNIKRYVISRVNKPAAEFDNNSTFQVEMWVVVGKSRSRYTYLWAPTNLFVLLCCYQILTSEHLSSDVQYRY